MPAACDSCIEKKKKNTRCGKQDYQKGIFMSRILILKTLALKTD